MRHEHPMYHWTRLHLRTASVTVTVTEKEGKREYAWSEKGSLIQEVTDDLLSLDESLLIKGRWAVLQQEPSIRGKIMVRDGWFQKPIIALWRISQAWQYVLLGCYYAGRKLLEEIIGEAEHG